MPSTHSPADMDHAHAAAQKVVETHLRLVERLEVGVTLARIDGWVAEILEDLGCKSAFLHYKQPRLPPFPSHSCLSPNDCVVHGAAGMTNEPMKPGDLLSIDIGVSYRGWIGDAAWTYAFREQSDLAKRLMDCGKEALRRGVAQLEPGALYLEFAKAVQGHAERECGFHCVRGLGGHGYGRRLHGPPYVANYEPDPYEVWQDAHTPARVGTLIAVEPMIAAGTSQTRQSRGEWPIFTADGSLSVHYEHDVYIGENGPRVLTQELEALPDIVG